MATAATSTSSTSSSNSLPLIQQALTNPSLNAALRQQLFATALRETLALTPATGYTGGQKISTLLQNVGILTAIDVLVSMTVTNNAASGGAALVPSVAFPYNLLHQIELRDYANTMHVQCSGVQLMQRNAVHNGRVPYAAAQHSEGEMSGGAFAYPTSAANGAIAADSSGTIQFYVRVPVSISQNTTVGAMLMQAITGQSYLNITLAPNSTTGGYDQPFTGNYSITNASVQLVQSYLQPQGSNLLSLPGADLQTIYELNGAQVTSDNLSVGMPKFLDFPNARTVHGMYMTFYNGALNYGTDLQELSIRASGNTKLDNNPPLLWIMRQREMLGADLMPGFYYYSTARVPVMTNYLGQVQMEMKPASLGTNPYVALMSENTYTSNTPLPGIGG